MISLDLKNLTKSPLTLDSHTREAIFSDADKYIDYSFPVISASDYMKFSKTGNRTDFEDKYFHRRRVLNSLILAEYIHDSSDISADESETSEKNKSYNSAASSNSPYLAAIIDGLVLLCEESGWQLPPHNSYGDGLGNQPLPDITRPVLDLFSLETGALLTFAAYLLKDRLDSASPFITKRIAHEVDKRILTPYLEKYVWWMGDGTNSTCNWTVWCTSNTLLCAIYSDISAARKKAIYEKAAKSLLYFLADYGEDGCCDEGALYYRHAGLNLWLSLELLEAVGYDMSVFEASRTKIKNIAEYILHVHVSGDYYINFADCAPNPGPCSAREFLFGKYVESGELMAFAASDYVLEDRRILRDEINLFYRFISLSFEKEITAYSQTHEAAVNARDIWYESVGLAIFRSQRMCVAAKAGDNDDSHNHNDTGSFILYTNGEPCFIDLGVGSYTATTFSSDRYSIWTMQSDFHNLPTINSTMQSAGAIYKAKDVEVSMSEGVSSISMDIAAAYPEAAGVKHYKRTIELDKSKNICTIEDSFELKETKSVILNLMTYEKPVICNTSIQKTCFSVGETHIEIDGCYDIDIEEIPIEDKRLSKSYSGSVYRLRISLCDASKHKNSRSFKMTCY